MSIDLHMEKGRAPFLKCWVGFSGGLDSTVLLHALLNGGIEADMAAVHIHHGLYADADDWAQQCQRLCREWGVEFHLLKVDASPQGNESPESAARRARYEALQSLVGPEQCLATAHHQDDQAETLLLQLFRGAGVQGLASMPYRTAFGQGFHIRPLLGCSREQIQAYATQYQLPWLDDHSNHNTRFDRNYVRHELMPRLQSRWPSISATVARSAGLQAEAADLLAELAQLDIEQMQLLSAGRLHAKALCPLSPRRQRNVLRYWIRSFGFSLPSQAVLEEILKHLSHAEDAAPQVRWGQHELRAYRGYFYLLNPAGSVALPAVIDWPFPETLIIPGLGLEITAASLPKALASYLAGADQIQVRFRRGGERLQLPGRKHHHRLKQLLQERAVPPWLRDRLPLVFAADQLIAVLGLNEPILAAEIYP